MAALQTSNMPTSRSDDAVAGEQSPKTSPTRIIPRETLCLASRDPGFTIHKGDDSFIDSLGQHFSPAESNALEKLVQLKSGLTEFSGTDEDFWPRLLKGITELLGCEYAFVASRILPDDPQAVVEMPAVGEPGYCFMAVAMYCHDGAGFEEHAAGFEYQAFGGPCAQMKHDKVFLIPSRVAEYAYTRASEFKVPVESFLGVPLTTSGRCFAHVGVLYSPTSNQKRALSWGFTEAMLHALEDMVVQRLVQRAQLKASKTVPDPLTITTPSVIPKSAVSIVPSLRPYARSLSHELRTPMQGIVGMLDIMQATVQDALEGLDQSRLTDILNGLRENMEVIQDSSRRAVEAADNVVHAYDLDMQVPSTPSALGGRAGSAEPEDSATMVGTAPSIESALTLQQPPARGIKRARSPSLDLHQTPPLKHPSIQRIEQQPPPASAASTTGLPTPKPTRPSGHRRTASEDLRRDVIGAGHATPATPANRPVVVRSALQHLVRECLRVGGRPASAVPEPTDTGERIEVRDVAPQGEVCTKLVEWSVDPNVPTEFLIDPRDFTKLVSAILLNAIKFTDRGTVRLQANVGPGHRYLVIRVIDTGSGIPIAFRPNLFKAFSREDDSLTRHNEGLGLGLMVAKGLARKIGGDLICVRSDTDGPQQGSEFEVRMPLLPGDPGSHPSTPSRSPTPVQLTVPADRPPLMMSRTEPVLQGGHPPSPQQTNESRVASNFAENVSPTAVTPNHSRILPSTAAVPAAVESSSSSSPAAAPSLPWTPASNASVSLGSEPEASVTAPTPVRPPLRSLSFNKDLAMQYPVRFMVAEDNRINRKLLVNMLAKLGYSGVHEAFDGREAVRLMEQEPSAVDAASTTQAVDVILMDLWMPNMDGFEAAQRILELQQKRQRARAIKILAVTADITDAALHRAREVGMQGFMTKPYKLMDLERLIVEHCEVA